jgi:ABC-2 type transport system permease protein
MAKHHNLGTVINFEFIRTVKKPSFWAATLAFPLLLIVIFGIAFYSGKASSDNSAKLAKEKFSIEYKDDSGIVQPAFATAFQAKNVTDKQQAIADVKSGKVDAFFYYPQDVATQKIEIYGKDAGLFNNGKYSAVAEQMLSLSAEQKIDSKQLVAIAKNKVASTVTTYKANGEVAAGWKAAIPPLIFLVLFYFTIAMLGNNLLNSTVEEKENRVTEMILTTLNPTDLIVGKLLATFLAGLLQAAVLLTPVIAAYLVLGSDAHLANLPNLDLIKGLVIDPQTMLIGALIFIGGLLLFTGTLVAVGAIMPTAKEAGQFFSIAIMMMFIPFYIIMLILSDPKAMVVQAFTFFPYTAPITAMLRNAFGSLDMTSAAIVISILLILGYIIIHLAVRLFRYGAMEYSRRLSLRTLFMKK